MVQLSVMSLNVAAFVDINASPICIRVADSNPLWMHRIGCMVHRWRLWSDSSRSHAEQGKDYYQKTIRAC